MCYLVLLGSRLLLSFCLNACIMQNLDTILLSFLLEMLKTWQTAVAEKQCNKHISPCLPCETRGKSNQSICAGCNWHLTSMWYQSCIPISSLQVHSHLHNICLYKNVAVSCLSWGKQRQQVGSSLAECLPPSCFFLRWQGPSHTSLRSWAGKKTGQLEEL